MADHGYFNFYTPPEYESYQQYQQHPSENERLSVIENTLNVFMQQSMINMHDTNQRLKSLSLQLEFMQAQLYFTQTIMDIQTNNQFLHEEQENLSTDNEEFGEIVEEGVDETEEDTILEECGELEITKEIETPNKEEFPQERSDTEEAKTVENEEMMKVIENKERLISKEESLEARGKRVSKTEIERVIDEICALFHKPRLGRIWTPHQLYCKFMEFLPKRRITKDDALSVSFHPP